MIIAFIIVIYILLSSFFRLNKKEKDFSIAIKKISNLESNIDELKNRVNQAGADRKRAEDEAKELQQELNNVNNQMEVLKKQLEEETLLRVDLENRLQSLKEEISFKETLHESELQETRTIQENEISERVNDQLLQQYEQRMADELRELREENEAQLRLNREDLERKFEAQLAELEKALEKRTTSESNSRNELHNLRTKNETLTSKLNQIESLNGALTSRIKDLERLIEQEREWKENALQDKEAQIAQLRDEMKGLVNDYSDLLDIKIALDMEISAYRKLLEGEESRLNISSSLNITNGASSPSSTTASARVVSPRAFTPRGTKRRRVILQEEENVTDIKINSNAKGDVEIIDHDQDGKYVKLFNKGEKEISLSGWQLVRKAGDLETLFKFHRSIVIKPNTSVTVWSSDTNAAHSPPSDIVMKGQTWFVAETMTTTLSNNVGEVMLSVLHSTNDS
jgi:lamin B